VRQLEGQTIAHRSRVKTWQKLSAVATDFIHAATTYGKIIISEVYLPATEKTIKPLSGRGIAGGEKYIVNSIMFKFAIDNSNLFGGDDHRASRVAGHDLLGLNCYLASNVEGIYTPLVCLVDYRGFRLVALSLLPIDRNSLIYGSDDAGSHIRTDTEAHALLLKCAKTMNTAEHEILELSTLKPQKLACAVDIEAHRSRLDGRIYVIDCSRAMPPSAVCRDSRYKGQCNHLTMLLRPELVQHFPKALCSDSYSSLLCPRNLILRKIQEKRNSSTYQIPQPQGKQITGFAAISSHSHPMPSNSESSRVYESPQVILVSSSTSYTSMEDNSDSYVTDFEPELVPTSGTTYDTTVDVLVYGDAPPDVEGSAGPKPLLDPISPSESQSTVEELESILDRLSASKHNAESDVADATNQLLHLIIPKFAENLQRILDGLPAVQQSIFAYDWLVVWLHWHGINIRHLGTLRTHISRSNQTLRALLLCIMLSRVLKNMGNHRLRMEMRRLKYAGEFPYQRCLVSFLNLVFGTSTESLVFWNLHLKNALIYQFPDALDEDELKMDLKVLVLDTPIVVNTSPAPTTKSGPEPSSSLPKVPVNAYDTLQSAASSPKLSHKSAVHTGLPTEPICFLFFTYCRLVGLKLKAGHSESFASNPGLFNVAEPLNVLDLECLPEKVKTLQIVSHAQGLVWKVRGEAASSLTKSKQFAIDLWTLALSAYKESLLANPRDQRTIRNVAEVYHSLGFPHLAGAFAHLAIETNPNDAVSLYKYASFIYATTKNEETAKRYYEAAIRTPSATPGAFLAYAEFSLKQRRTEQALALVEQCLQHFPNSWDALHKMAYLQHFIVKNYDLAHEYYKKALDLESKDLVLLNHYITFLRTIVHDDSLASSYELFIKKLEQKTTISGRGSKLWDASYLAPPSNPSQ
jgi:tetratricopeptide (TPR) repeat protein